MHPKEWKQEKAGTGRLTHLCLPNSEIIMGTEFTANERVNALLGDPAMFPLLLYPGPEALNVSAGGVSRDHLGERQMVVFLLDATWACARKMLRLSPNLQTLPRIMFSTTAVSRYVIKQQPQEGCLSTLEATHELLVALDRAGLDSYSNPEQLHSVFDRMQRFQIECASDSSRQGYRRKSYSTPDERRPLQGRSGARRNRYIPEIASNTTAVRPTTP